MSEEAERHNAYQRAYYARPRRAISPEDSPYVQRHLTELLRDVPLEPHHPILEIGAGSGRFTVPLVHRGLSLTAQDLSQDLLTQLTSAVPEVPTDCGDVVGLASRLSTRFDRVIGFFILHHLLDLG